MAMSISQKKVDKNRFILLKRLLLTEIVPFILMLVIFGWLALLVGQRIDKLRGENIELSPIEVTVFTR